MSIKNALKTLREKTLGEYINIIGDILTSRIFIVFALLCIGYTVSKIWGSDNPAEEITEQILKLLGVDVEFSK